MAKLENTVHESFKECVDFQIFSEYVQRKEGESPFKYTQVDCLIAGSGVLDLFFLFACFLK